MYQQTTLIGNVGKAPEMRYTPSGVAVTNFTMAVNEKHGENKTTTWFRVAVWNKQAETVNQYVKAGMLVAVIGRLAPEIKVFESNGTHKAQYEINANEVKFLSRVEAEAEREAEYTAPDDNIPF
jgi:single-strand DNA-binding protein